MYSWEQRKLGSIGSTYTGLSGKTKEDFGHGEAQYITYLNVFQNTISDITMTDKVEIDTTQNEVKYGDVLFTTSSETPEEVGMSSVWLGDTPNIYLNSFCFGFRPNQKIDPYFLGYSLRAPYMRDKIKILAQGISRYNISKNKVMELEISLPNNNEQKLLGDFLQHIDLIITLHQRKLDNLKLKKKALLQKLFPKNGERYPELRFPGFTDTWEQRKFSDLYEKISEKNDLSYSLDKIISVANMYYKSDAKVSNEEYLKTYNIFRYGEIAFEGNKSKDFTYGRFVENTIGDGIISHVFEVFRPITKYDIYFWKYYINYEPIMGKVLSRCTKKTTMMTNLVAKDFLKETVFVPSLAEQKRIGILLNTLDKSITLHQQKPFLCGNSVNGGVELC